MSWRKYSDELPKHQGVFSCKMKDGSEKELILHIENDWDENTLSSAYWYHWFETEQDKENWSPLEEEDEPQYWYDSNYCKFCEKSPCERIGISWFGEEDD